MTAELVAWTSPPTVATHARALARPTLIEAFSLPGAGKSTLVRTVAPAARLVTTAEMAAAWDQLPPARRGAHIARAMLDPACLRTAVHFAVRARLTHPDSLLRLLRIVAKADWLRSQRDLVLLDQGFLQGLWSVCVSARRFELEPRRLAPLIRCLYRGVDARIVYLQVDEAVASQRVGKRTHGKSRFDGLPPEVIGRRLSRASRLLGAIVAAAEEAGLAVEHLDGAAPVPVLADRLRLMVAQAADKQGDGE